MRSAAIVTTLLAVSLVASSVRAQSPSVILIQNATILTVTHGNIEHGSILIRDGKIAAVGTDIKMPDGATVIDATGQYVMPGIVDCHSHIAVDGSVNEAGPAVSSMARIPDVLNPEDIDIYRDLAGGVTAANILHGSANPIGGQTIVIKLRWGKPASELPFEGALPGIKFALGENPKRSNFQPPPGVPQRYPGTRMGVEEVIRQAFTEAREYKKQWDDYNQRNAAGEQNLIPPRRNDTLEPLVEVLEGKRYVHSHCYRADEILMLLRVAKEFGFQVRTFQHVLEGYKIADEIAASGAGGSTFSDWWAYKMEAFDATPYNAALMMERGVIVSVNSDDADEARHLNQEAAKSMKYGGLSANDALKLVTLNPAIQLGIDNRVGSIDVGKDADLVIYNHDPLSVYAVAQKTLIDGQVYFDRQRDISQRAELEKEKQALLDKEKKASEEAKKSEEKDKEKQEAKPEKKPDKKKPTKAGSETSDGVAGGAR
jgi:imidazolonepropionase-like amidohydrolase